MGTVVRLGERKEDNSIITPLQLLDIVKEEIESGEAPVTGLLIIGVSSEVDGDNLYTYRCRLDIDKEQSILANRLLLTQLKRLGLYD
jgi:hypothetical protein